MSAGMKRRARVITSSTRAAAGVWEDRSGPVLVEGLDALGFDVDAPVVVADGEPLLAALRAWAKINDYKVPMDGAVVEKRPQADIR